MDMIGSGKYWVAGGGGYVEPIMDMQVHWNNQPLLKKVEVVDAGAA